MWDAGWMQVLWDHDLFAYLYSSFTVRAGGHSRHILRRLSGAGRLIAFDVDGQTRCVLEIGGRLRLTKRNQDNHTYG